MRISSLLSDGMVLQREQYNAIWGWTQPAASVHLEMEEYHTQTKASEDGYFELVLPRMQAGGPWDIRLSDGQEERVFSDVLFGDVFLLGGQSNMELPLSWIWDGVGDELSGVSEDEIRMFDVPKEYDFVRERDILTAGKWVKATGCDLQAFSAVGFFAAREIRKSEQVPIGLLQTAVGGTPVKAWCSEETVRRLGYDGAELDVCKDKKMVEETISGELQREQDWWAEVLAPFSAGEEIVCDRKINLPGFFAGELQQYTGSLFLKKEIVLTEEDLKAEGKIKLYLGAVIDADFVYVNGVKVGETAFRYPPRVYEVPKGLLSAGKNEIEIRMLVLRQNGGFMPGKAYKLLLASGREISLEGEWDCALVRQMPILPETTFFQYKATGLYNGMLSPLKKQKIRGCFFYQGESNAEVAYRYEQEFSAMIADWRALWEEPTLPFIYVQLAGFADGKLPCRQTDWAHLRQAQLQAERNKNVRMVQAYDLGEYNDLHPFYKEEVGRRIALAARNLIYQKSDFAKGPVAKQLQWQEEYVTILFETDKPLTVRNGDGEIAGFEIREASGEWKAAPAHLLSDDRVRIEITDRTQEIAYAWNNCPMEANLYAGSGMPAVPFQRKKGE